MSWNRFEPFGRRDVQSLFLGALDDPLRNRVFGIAFDRRCNTKGISRAQAPICRHVDDAELAAREGACLVENHCCEVSRFLETSSVADEKPRLGAERGGDCRY